METIMVLSEIKKKFDSDWVLVTDPKTDSHLEVIAGKVLCHSKERSRCNQTSTINEA